MSSLHGVEAMLAALDAIKAQVVATTPAALNRAAHFVEGAVKQKLSLTSHPPGTPTPSAPGSPPSLVSGALRRSIAVNGATLTGPGRWTARVGPSIVYGPIQERGGVAGRGAHLPARPYVAPALAESHGAIHAVLEQAWSQAMQ